MDSTATGRGCRKKPVRKTVGQLGNVMGAANPQAVQLQSLLGQVCESCHKSQLLQRNSEDLPLRNKVNKEYFKRVLRRLFSVLHKLTICRKLS